MSNHEQILSAELDTGSFERRPQYSGKGFWFRIDVPNIWSKLCPDHTQNIPGP